MPGKLGNAFLHRRREQVEVDDALDDASGVVGRERLEVREERALGGNVGLGDRIEPSMNGIVGPLKEASFAVGDELRARVTVTGLVAVEARSRQDDRSR